MTKKILLPALIAIGIAMSVLGDVGDARSTFDDLVAWARTFWTTGDHGLSNNEIYFVVGIATLTLVVLVIQRLLREQYPEGAERESRRFEERAILDEPDARKRYLRWLELDVENRLKESIHGAVLLDIGMEEDAGATRPWYLRATSTQDESREFHTFASVLGHFNHRVLLLGGPGSGKTTTLLDAILKATKRALDDDDAPIPVYFNLSVFSDRPAHDRQRWRRRKGEDAFGPSGLTQEDVESLETQMITQMARLPSTNRAICAKWFQEGRVGLYLDGLDEVAAEYAKTLVQQINYGYCKRFTDRPLIVASRIIEYRTLQESREGGLRVDGAATLQSLDADQIQDYLQKCTNAEGLRAALNEDETLKELASSPLTLSMMALAYGNRSQGEIPSHASLPQQRRDLFDAFVPKMMQRQARRARGEIFSLDEADTLPTAYSVKQVNDYLGWLAVQLSARMRTLFSVRGLYGALRPEGPRGHWDLTASVDALVLAAFSILAMAPLALKGTSAFPLGSSGLILFSVALFGFLVGTYVDRLEDLPGPVMAVLGTALTILALFCLAVCALSIGSLTPDGGSDFLLLGLAGLAILLSTLLLAPEPTTKPNQLQDADYREYVESQRSRRLQTLRDLRLLSAAAVIGGALGLGLWSTLGVGTSWFNWVAITALLGLVIAMFLRVQGSLFLTLLSATLLTAIWTIGRGLELLPWTTDPLVPLAVVMGVMGVWIGVSAKGIELGGTLLLLACGSSVLVDSAIAGGLVFVPFAARMDAAEGRLAASLRERFCSPVLAIGLVLGRVLPIRLRRFLGYCQASLLLKQTGSDLEFSHRVLRDHFATRDLLQGLATAHGQDRQRIVQQLGAQGEAALEVLSTLLEDPNAAFRETAVRSICRIPSEDSVHYLMAVLREDPSPQVRAATLDAIGRLSSDDLVAQALQDPSPAVRAAIAPRLSGFWGQDQPWAKLLTDRSPDVVRATLAAAGKRSISDSFKTLRLDPSSEAGILPFCSSRDRLVRRSCANVLGSYRTATATSALSALLRDTDPNIRLRAAKSLLRQRTRGAFEVLKELAGSANPQLRLVAASAFGWVAALPDVADESTGILIGLTRDRDAEVRAAAYGYLPGAMEAASVPYLVDGLKDRRKAVRLACVRALGKRSGKAPPELVAALASRPLSLAAADSLVRRQDDSIAPAVSSALRARPCFQRLAATIVAGGLRVEEAVPDLEALRRREAAWQVRARRWLEARLAASVDRHQRLELQSRLGEVASGAIDFIHEGRPDQTEVFLGNPADWKQAWQRSVFRSENWTDTGRVSHATLGGPRPGSA